MTRFTPELLAGLALFAFVSSITPGPNNTMLLASGANFGVRRTLPHLAGVVIGFVVLLVAAGLMLGGLFAAYPALHDVLKIAGALYLIWLAWKIARSDGLADAGVGAQPMTFLQAAAFQWVNPKALTMALTAVSTYAPSQGFAVNVLIVGLVFGLVNLPCIASWTAFGAALRRVLERPGALKAFNWTMAALLALSLAPLAVEAWERAGGG